jgi:hypothetical protein
MAAALKSSTDASRSAESVEHNSIGWLLSQVAPTNGKPMRPGKLVELPEIKSQLKRSSICVKSNLHGVSADNPG